ncbi:MAG: cytochrome P450 [Planctomycetota bacterium]|jgi:cytochrome P450
MQTRMQKEFSFQPFTEEFARDPYAVYACLREEHPIYYYKEWGLYLLSSYEDIATLVNDSRMVRTLDHVMPAEAVAARREVENWSRTPNISRYVRVSMLDSEGEMHDRLRKLVFRKFTPVRVQALRVLVQAYVDQRIDMIIGDREMDFIEDFVATIPGYVIGHLLGVPAEDRLQLRLWSEHIVQFFEPERTVEQIQLAEDTCAEFADYLSRLAAERRVDPQDDLISELVAAMLDGHLNEDELVSTCMLILMAGHGSTIDVSGNGMLALLKHPQELDKLRSQPAFTQTAVQEMFRYDPPLPYFHRFLLEDMEYKNLFFKKGTKFGVIYASANRDAAQFENPDLFDVTRQPNRHLAFGIGAHFCLGNHLARLNMDIMFTSILKRIPNITLATENPEFRIGLASRGLKVLPVSW